MRRVYIFLVVVALVLFSVSCESGRSEKRAVVEQFDPQKTYNNFLNMNFQYIPAGSFMMGGIPTYSFPLEWPQHLVNITRGFYMQTTEVTQAQWREIMGNNPSWQIGDEQRPVDTVSWIDVQSFIDILNLMENTTAYRLPTEAEWEYACRAGTTTLYYCGDLYCQNGSDIRFLELYEWFDVPYPYESRPVGMKLPNPWGLYDMHGNVREWCQDWFSDVYYSISPVDDPPGPDEGVEKCGYGRVVRGGCFYTLMTSCRSSVRSSAPDFKRSYEMGFRLVYDPD